MDRETLYANYQRAKKEWLEFASKEATEQFNKKLKDAGRIHNTSQCRNYVFNVKYGNIVIKKEKTISGNTRKIYKKLSIIYHPDKFKRTDAIFKAVGKYAKDDNFEMLKFIDDITSDIIDCDDDLLEKFCKILDGENDDKLKKHIEASNCSFKDAVSKFVSGEIIDAVMETSCARSQDIYDTFMNSYSYQWYVGDEKTKKFYENIYYTDDELMEHFKTDLCDEELDYYFETGGENIKKFIISMREKKRDKLLETNVELKKQNEILINKIAEDCLEGDITTYGYCKCLSNENLDKILREKMIDKICKKDPTEIPFFDKFIELGIDEINKAAFNHIKAKLEKYINLPPLHKTTSTFYPNAIRALQFIDQTKADELKDIYTETVNELVELISKVDITDWFFRDVSMFKNEKITIAIGERYKQYAEIIPDTDFTRDVYKFKSLCTSTNDTIREVSLDKLNREKDKYIDLYNQIYIK